jgi:hypothetical protein
MESFPASMGRLELESLDISNNELGSIPKCIFEIASLKTLKACHCTLNEVSASIEKLAHLVDLRLSNNWLVAIPIELCNLVQLEILHLDHNRLTQLPHKVINWSKLGTELDCFMIGGNNMVEPPQDVCDRGIRAIISYIDTHDNTGWVNTTAK